MREVMKYDYKSKDGNVVGYVSRLEEVKSGDVKPRKQTIPHFKPNGQAGIPQEMPPQNRFYGLESIRDTTKPVYVVEGEKCAFALHGLGFQAITSLGGCGQGRLAPWEETFDGIERVCLLPDNDPQGAKYTYGIYQRLKRVKQQPKVKIVHLPGLPEKGDVCDWLAKLPELEGWDEIASLSEHPNRQTIAEKLNQAVLEAASEPPPEWSFTTTKAGFRTIDVANLSRLEIPRRKALLAPWLLEASISMVFADRGLGKTFFCLSVGQAVARGGRFLDYEAEEPFPVLYLDGEMQSSDMQRRLKMLSDGLKADIPLHVFTPDLQNIDDMPNLSHPQGQAFVDEMIEATGAKLVVIDNISTFMRTGNENDAESWALVQPWLIKHRKYKRAILLVHHANKEGKQRGTHKKEDVLDVVIQLKRPDDFVQGVDDTRLEVSFTKGRHLHGEQAKSLEATLSNKDGKLVWACKEADGKFQETVRLLKEQKLTQAEIAETVDVAKGTVSKWKRRAISEGLL